MSDPLLRQHERRFHLEHLGLTLLLGLFCVLLTVSSLLAPLDRRLFDRFSASLTPTPHPDLLLVAVDDYSLHQLGRWPWDRSLHARLIERLTEGGARAVMYDIMLSEPDLLRPDSDAALVEALTGHGRVYLPVHVDQLRGGKPVEALPWRQFAEVAHRLGHVDLVRDGDGLVRGLWLRAGAGQAFWPHMGLAVLEDELPVAMAPYQRRGRGEGKHNRRITEHPRRLAFGPMEIPRVSAADVIDGRIPATLLADRIVLVGTTAVDTGDVFAVPGARGVEAGVEIHARVISGLFADELIENVGPASSVLLSLLVALLAPLWLPLCRPRQVPVLIVSLLAGAVLLSVALLWLGAMWWSPTAALVTVVMAAPLWTWRRLQYSVDYITGIIAHIMQPGEKSGRLQHAADLAPLLRMLRVLPLRAWRLENRGAGELQTGGDPVEETCWQGQSARHYEFQREQNRYELSLIWRSPTQGRDLDDTVRAMVARVAAPPRADSAALRPIAPVIESLGTTDRRQRGFTRVLYGAVTKLDRPVLLADACGQVLMVNNSLLNLLGLDNRPLQGWHLLDLARDLRLEPADWSRCLAEAVEQGNARLEIEGSRGETLQVSLTRVDTGPPVIQMLMLEIGDVTELVQARHTRTELLQFLSHDMRSPMISILALTEKMRQNPVGTVPSDFLDQLDLHARRNLNVAEQFLQLLRVEAMPHIDMMALDMLPVVESALEKVRPDAQRADVVLRLDYDDEQPVWVRGNHELLVRLLNNLLRNAVRYSAAGGSVDVCLLAAAGEVRVEVRDRGPGIPLARQADLFTRTEHGKGLGLRYVDLVARRHGGRVTVESTPGEGARFTLALPALAEDEL